MIRRLVATVTGRDTGVASGDGHWLVAGLGNPGRQYSRNRHNVGFMVADLLAERLGARLRRHKRAVAEVAEGRLGYGGPRLVVAKPMSFMNRSGAPVAELSRFYTIPAERIIAVHDDLDLDYGTLRAKQGGGEGGHNGLRSMATSLATKDFIRVRFGVGRPPGRQDPADWVLSDFSAAERKDLDYLIDRSADVVETIISKGLEPAQNLYHRA